MSKKKKARTIETPLEEELFGEFAFIAGYTEGGVPYGVLHDDWVDLEPSEEGENDPQDELLPF